MFKNRFGIWLLILISSLGCASKPQKKTVDFQMAWTRATTQTTNWTFNRSERTAPLVDDAQIVQGNGFDGVVAYDRSKGTKLWNVKVANGVESGLATANGLLYFGASDGQFYCVEKGSGRIAWTFPTRTENLAAPLVENGYVFFLAGNNILYALDAKTGKQVWVYRREEVASLSIRGGSRPTLYRDNLYVGFSDGYVVSLNYRDGSLAWERKLSNNPKFIDVDSTPVIQDNFLYVSSYDGALYALSRNDGQIQWRFEEGGATAVTIDGDKLYYGSTGQAVFALKRETGEVVWKYPLEVGVPTQPVIANGLVFFGNSNDDLIALDQSNGQKVGAFRPGAGVFATPFVDSFRKEIVMFSNGANLYILKYKVGTNYDSKRNNF